MEGKLCSVCQRIDGTVGTKHKVSFGAVAKGIKQPDIGITLISSVPLCNVCINSLLMGNLQNNFGRWLVVRDKSELTPEQLKKVEDKKGTLMLLEEEGDDGADNPAEPPQGQPS